MRRMNSDRSDPSRAAPGLTAAEGNPGLEGDGPHKSSDLDGGGEFQQARGKREERRIPASEDRGLLPAVPPGDKAPVGTVCLQTRLTARKAAEVVQREKGTGSPGLDQGPMKGIVVSCFQEPDQPGFSMLSTALMRHTAGRDLGGRWLLLGFLRRRFPLPPKPSHPWT